MKKTLMNQVTNSIFEVMETMFYITAEEKKDVPQDKFSLFNLDSLKAGRISCSGKFSGAIFLLMPSNVLISMTHNFLGEDKEQLSDDLIEGTLKEALNMIAGNALTKMDEQSYTGLGIPELINPADISPDDSTVIFDTTEGMMAAHVELDD